MGGILVVGLGVLVIVIMGAMLSLISVLLPRLLPRWEGRGAGPPGFKEMRPAAASPLQERITAPLPPEPRAAPAAEPEEALVAAAIAMALRLYQEAGAPLPEMAPPAGGGSPWSLAGRWQAMQARLNLGKR